MSDLIDDPLPGENAPEFSVSELSGAVKRTIEGAFSHVRVRGEVGRVVRARSGHLYFDLKDERAVISGVSWKGQAARLTVQPEEGMEVIATGRLTTFPGQSKYQIVVDDIRPAGVGALMAMLEKRKKALAAEGLFDEARKRPIPYLPGVIGVVTSPSGAVIRDILHRLRDRFPSKVLIWPVTVQGDRCAPEVAAAIRGFNALEPGGAVPRPDLLIVARGGGSIEDLWGFNEEIVVRAAAQSAIPLISAVGHETDTTLIDFAADRRAPTPTAAAEMAVPVRRDLIVWVEGQGARLTGRMAQTLERKRQRLSDLSRGLPRPERLYEVQRQRLDHAGDRLPKALASAAIRARARLSGAAAVLRRGTLERQIEARRERLVARVDRLPGGMRALIRDRRRRVAEVAAGLRPVALRRLATDRSERLWALERRRVAAGEAAIARRGERLTALSRVLSTLGYEGTLKRGFAVVRGDGKVVTGTAEARQAMDLEIQFKDGRLAVGQAPRPARARGDAADTPDQGSLF